MRLGEHDELAAIRDELDGLRAEFDAVRRPSMARRAVGRVRAARRLTVVGIAALLLAVPVAVSANHLFSDVPTSNTFHTTIGRLAGAGITGGCGSGKFCPNANVTRGQMSAFLNRGLGRGTGGIFGDATWDDVSTLDAATPATLVAIAEITTGGGAGGTGHVLVTGYFNAWTNEDLVCPCDIHAWVEDLDTGEFSAAVFDTITDIPAPSGDATGPFYQATVSVSHLFTATSGSNWTYAVYGKLIPTNLPTTPPVDPMFTGWVSGMQAVYVPFAGDGSNPLMPAITGSGTPPSRGGIVNPPPKR